MLTLKDVALAIDPGVKDYFLQTGTKTVEQYKEFMNVQTGITDYTSEDSGVTGLGIGGFITEENGTPAEDNIFELAKKTYTQKHVGLMMSFSEDVWKFGIKVRKIESVVQELKEALVRLREKQAIGFINNAFATSFTLTTPSGSTTIATVGRDSVCAASAAHTRPDGGANFSNIITDENGTVNLPLYSNAYAALKAAVLTASKITDHRGNPLGITYDTVIVAQGSRNHLKLLEAMGAIKAGKVPEAFSADAAAVGMMKIIAVPRQYLTNTDYWACFDSTKQSNEYGFQYLESEQIGLEGPDVVFKTGKIWYKSNAWWVMDFADVRNWGFSKGTGAA